MNSSILREQKNRFISSTVLYKDKYQGIIEKLTQMNINLENDDKLVHQYIIDRNNEIIAKINKLCADVDIYRSIAEAKINSKINELDQLMKDKKISETLK